MLKMIATPQFTGRANLKAAHVILSRPHGEREGRQLQLDEVDPTDYSVCSRIEKVQLEGFNVPSWAYPMFDPQGHLVSINVGGSYTGSPVAKRADLVR